MLNQAVKRLLLMVTAALTAVMLGFSAPALAVNWSAAETLELQLFYPGETSLEWIYNKRSHDGAARYKRRKKGCKDCHDGDEAAYGPKIAAGGDTESAPLKGRRGYVTMKLQAVNDGSQLYLRLRWPKAKAAAAEQQDPDNNTKLTVMLDDNSVEEFTSGGCWAVCHIDTKKMPTDGDKEKYLADSRSRMSKKKGGGDNYRSAVELQSLLSKGVFLEYWQAQLNPGQPASVLDGYILQERSENAQATVRVVATESSQYWLVEFSRPLAGGANRKAITADKIFTLRVALHDQHTAGRYHLASLQFTLSLGDDAADLVARRR